MISRRYTVAEIEALRDCFENKYLWGSYTLPEGVASSNAYRESDKITTVEEWVRTHMMAGHTAEDLINSEK